MPVEFRYVIFNAEETVLALKEYRKRRREPWPAGSIVSVKCEADPSVKVSIEIAPDGSQEPYLNTFHTAEVAAALIMYCINSRVPIPVDATKSLELMGNNVSLLVHKVSNISAPANPLAARAE